jgi:hypothetical protein
MTKAWAPEQQAVEVGEGDILNVLKSVREQYRKKSENGTNPSWMFYKQQVENVDRLINQ